MGCITLIAFVLSSLLLCPLNAQASTPTKVKILTWWGYLEQNSEQIKNIEKRCLSKIIIDEFYSSSEFLSRINSNLENFDILIYSDTVFKSLQTSFISKAKSKTSLKRSGYSKDIQAFFDSRSYGPNTSIFQTSLSGFLINKDLMLAHKNEPFSSFFKKAGNHIITLLDDHVEIATLLNK